MTLRKRALSALAAILLVLPLFLARPGIVQAEAPVGPSFTVDAVLPENQLEAQGYFSLLVKPEQNQLLWVQVQNHLDEILHLRVSVTGSQTSAGGLIVYEAIGGPQGGGPLSLPDLLAFYSQDLEVGPEYAIRELTDEYLTLAPGASIRLPFLLTLPKEPLEGHILGGIVLTQVEGPSLEESSGFQIKSEFSYAIAVQLQSRRTQEDITPSFSFGGASVAEQAGFPAVSFSLSNDQPLVVTGASLRLEIFDTSDTEKPLLQRQVDRVAMAPLSTMAYGLSLQGDQALAPGTYRVRITLTFQGETHTFEGTFTIPEPAR